MFARALLKRCRRPLFFFIVTIGTKQTREIECLCFLFFCVRVKSCLRTPATQTQHKAPAPLIPPRFYLSIFPDSSCFTPRLLPHNRLYLNGREKDQITVTTEVPRKFPNCFATKVEQHFQRGVIAVTLNPLPIRSCGTEKREISPDPAGKVLAC